MSGRKPIDQKAGGLMLALCAIWGLQQVALKGTAQDMAPILQLALRSGFAAMAVAVLVFVRKEGWALKGGAWRPGLLVGALFALEFLLVGEGLRFTTASHMSIFLYTAPIFAALGLHFRMADERLSLMQWGGVAVAFAGIAVSFLGQGEAAGELQWLGDLLGLAAGAAWGATTLAVRFSRLSNAPATVTLLYQLAGAGVLLLAGAVVMGQTEVAVTPLLIASLSFQTIIVSFGSYLAWFGLLRIYLASRLGMLSFMTPLFGVGFGVLLLGEQLSPSFIFGGAMVLAGLLLVSGREIFARRRRASA